MEKVSIYNFFKVFAIFFEDRWLIYGSLPWHLGIIVVVIGHLIAFFLPGVWQSALRNQGIVIIVEAIGFGAALLAAAGLIVLIIRRITSARLQIVTSTADIAVSVLILLQVLLGIHTALSYRYGSVWSVGTVVPYLWSVILLKPDISFVANFPMSFKLHIAFGWLIIAVLPFTRLIHLLAAPVSYIWRSPQIVIWNNFRRGAEQAANLIVSESRREFIKGIAGIGGAVALLGIGVSDKLLNYFRGASLSKDEEIELYRKKLQRIQQTADERELELERMRKNLISVARYSELSETRGIYFIDYNMLPGLAFLGKDGLPIVISAKCTHLGCTVGRDVDSQGRILCPCHISYFDISSGKPTEGSPAKAPLPKIRWALVDGSGKIVASQIPGQSVKGDTNPELLKQCVLHIVKPGIEIG